ncbi:MarR family winged helix-turn-helix transcriptional regulator [Streptomyces sp. V2I9]|uniref:MarR family winged helix-turn-helix transcriptional regulator n=1 Tax=Streptomyces sp. V2I9 TaxID=3042304 RepID=UPI00278440EE|nr:MarR family transcriptional regulator [Streptomyces sp. V2I9]MDQ0984091.1 DNA-binding MarR family transcriptional regulator [Streptomyces sp. V2I9]
MDGKSRQNAARERPRATPEQAHARMDRLMALGIVAQHDIASRLGLNITDLTCLGFVLEAEGTGTAATAGELARRAHLTTGAITGVITRLERAGYVRRQSDPADRRRVRVVAEPTSTARIFEVYGPNYQRFAALFAEYGPDEIAVLADWLERATEIITTSADEMRGGTGPG